MAKRLGRYTVPFDFPSLLYNDAVELAADTGTLPGTTGPLLETVVDLLDELGRPDEHFDCIQVAGTNGKTSTARFSAALLRGRAFALLCTPLLSSCATRSAWRWTVASSPPNPSLGASQ